MKGKEKNGIKATISRVLVALGLIVGLRRRTPVCSEVACKSGVAFEDAVALRACTLRRFRRWFWCWHRFVCCRHLLAWSRTCSVGCVQVSLSVAHDAECCLHEAVPIRVGVVLARFEWKGAC